MTLIYDGKTDEASKARFQDIQKAHYDILLGDANKNAAYDDNHPDAGPPDPSCNTPTAG